MIALGAVTTGFVASTHIVPETGVSEPSVPLEQQLDFERLMEGAKKVKTSEFAAEMIRHMG